MSNIELRKQNKDLQPSFKFRVYLFRAKFTLPAYSSNNFRRERLCRALFRARARVCVPVCACVWVIGQVLPPWDSLTFARLIVDEWFTYKRVVLHLHCVSSRRYTRGIVK